MGFQGPNTTIMLIISGPENNVIWVLGPLGRDLKKFA